MPPTAIILVLMRAAIAAYQGAMPGVSDSLSAAFRASSQQAALMAVTAVWQGAIIAFGLAICLHLAPRTSAAHRFYLWAAAFATLVCLPLLTLISGFGSNAVADISSRVPEAAARPWFTVDARWSLLIAALWAAGTLLRAGDLALHSGRLRRLWTEAIPVDLDSHLNFTLESIKSRKPIEICTTTTLQRPSVIGFFKPRILIPDWLFARLTPGELEQIVLHEAEHLRRRDDWTNLLQRICLVFFPLNPVLLWIESRLCREREMACDEGVIGITHAPRAYAACLASLAERGLERRAEALSLGAWQRRPELVHRVHSILGRKGKLGPAGTRVLLGALGCSLLFGSIALARCPQLIAFVPARNQDLGAAGRTAPASPQVPPARLVDAGYVPVRSAGAGHGATGFRAVNLEAVLPPSSPVQTGDAPPDWRVAGEKSGAGLVHETPAYKPDLRALHAVFLKAEPADTQSAQPAEQQWIVLTTIRTEWVQVQPSSRTEWVQVQPSSQNAGLTADYQTGANAASETTAANGTNAATETSVQSNQQPASQITITRLILKVSPASPFSTQPAYVPLRGGWFVIQL